MGFLKTMGLGAQIILKGTKAVAVGSVRTLETATLMLDELNKGNPRGASRALGNYIGDGLVAGASTLNAADKLLCNAAEAEKTGKFMTQENEKLIVKVAAAGAVFATGSTLLDSDADTANGYEAANSDLEEQSNNIFGIDNSGCPIHGSDCDAF